MAKVKMVDISSKEPMLREASASGEIRLKPETMRLIREGRVVKGDPIQIATLAGIQGSKLTSLIMPLCHPVQLEGTDLKWSTCRSCIKVSATVRCRGKTGVEMEALTAVTVALLNIWDVVKMYEKDDRGQYPSTMISNVKVVEKVKKPLGER